MEKLCRPYIKIFLKVAGGRIHTSHPITLDPCSSPKTLWGGWCNFSRKRRLSRDGHYTCKGMVYAKIFYGGMVLFSRGMAPPAHTLNSSTAWIRPWP